MGKIAYGSLVLILALSVSDVKIQKSNSPFSRCPYSKAEAQKFVDEQIVVNSTGLYILQIPSEIQYLLTIADTTSNAFDITRPCDSDCSYPFNAGTCRNVTKTAKFLKFDPNCDEIEITSYSNITFEGIILPKNASELSINVTRNSYTLKLIDPISCAGSRTTFWASATYGSLTVNGSSFTCECCLTTNCTNDLIITIEGLMPATNYEIDLHANADCFGEQQVNQSRIEGGIPSTLSDSKITIVLEMKVPSIAAQINASSSSVSAIWAISPADCIPDPIVFHFEITSKVFELQYRNLSLNQTDCQQTSTVALTIPVFPYESFNASASTCDGLGKCGGHVSTFIRTDPAPACLLDVEKLMVKVFPYNISISWSLRAENCTGPTTFQASAESHEGVNASSGLFSVTDCDTNEKMVLLTLTSLKCSTMYEITVTADVLGFNQEIIANFAKDTPLPDSHLPSSQLQAVNITDTSAKIICDISVPDCGQSVAVSYNAMLHGTDHVFQSFANFTSDSISQTEAQLFFEDLHPYRLYDKLWVQSCLNWNQSCVETTYSLDLLTANGEPHNLNEEEIQITIDSRSLGVFLNLKPEDCNGPQIFNVFVKDENRATSELLLLSDTLVLSNWSNANFNFNVHPYTDYNVTVSSTLNNITYSITTLPAQAQQLEQKSINLQLENFINITGTVLFSYEECMGPTVFLISLTLLKSNLEADLGIEQQQLNITTSDCPIEYYTLDFRFPLLAYPYRWYSLAIAPLTSEGTANITTKVSNTESMRARDLHSDLQILKLKQDEIDIMWNFSDTDCFGPTRFNVSYESDKEILTQTFTSSIFPDCPGYNTIIKVIATICDLNPDTEYTFSIIPFTDKGTDAKPMSIKTRTLIPSSTQKTIGTSDPTPLLNTTLDSTSSPSTTSDSPPSLSTTSDFSASSKTTTDSDQITPWYAIAIIVIGGTVTVAAVFGIFRRRRISQSCKAAADSKSLRLMEILEQDCGLKLQREYQELKMTVDQHYINSTDGKSDDIYTHNLPSSKQLILCKGAFLVKAQENQSIQYIAAIPPADDNMDQFFEMVLTKNVKIIVDLLALGSMYDPDVAYIDLNEMESLDFCGTGADFSITSGCLTRLGEESLFPTICSKKFSILRDYQSHFFRYLSFKKVKHDAKAIQENFLDIVRAAQSLAVEDNQMHILLCYSREHVEQLLPFIAVDHLLKQIDSNSKTVNVFKTVHDIIQQDSRLIVTLDNYRLIYRALAQAVRKKFQKSSENRLETDSDNIYAEIGSFALTETIENYTNSLTTIYETPFN